jgi:CheY-like chemotaxis protein
MTEAVENKPTLLVVDDSRLMRVAARKILQGEFNILEASDGEEAWDVLQASPHVSLVMSDLSMPNLDGLGLLERIRTSDSADIQNLPVIIVTGAEDDDGSKTTALAAGASDFITKPFESVQLLSVRSPTMW